MLLMVGAVGLAAATALWMQAQMADQRPVSSLLPPGALLYVEAKDFHQVLAEWNGSGERTSWLKSKNFEELSVSRLIQRLGQAAGEFGSVSGATVGMTLTDQVAGTRSGFAFYDLGSIGFVYISQLSQTRIEASDLWQRRTGFQAREVGGVPFYFKTDTQTNRTVAFASYKGWFVLASDEARMAQTLVLLSGGKAPTLASEEWFAAALQQRQTMGALRLVYNMNALLQTAQYRTYWIHRNASEMKAFSAGIADLFEREDGFTEERVLLRKSEVIAPTPGTNSLGPVASYAAAGGNSLLRAWSTPDEAQIAKVVKQVVAGENALARVGSYEPAPGVSTDAGTVGSESDLEVRLDEPPFQRASEQPITPLVKALLAMRPTALAHVQLTTVLRDQVFVLPQSGLVVLCQQPDRTALDSALAQAASGLQTGSLDPLSVSVNGQAVVLSRVPLTPGLGGAAVGADVTYVATYDHQTEWPRYKKLFSILDLGAGGTEPGISANAPAFFSGNLGSLGDALSRLRRASIMSADAGAAVRETVQYEMARKP